MTKYMGNAIVLIILLLAVGAAIVPTINHFRGQGGCCGGSSYKASKKKLEHVIARKTFYVEGMHCVNCSNRVMEALNKIPGISATVKLKKKKLIISYSEMIEDSVIREEIKRIGYVMK